MNENFVTLKHFNFIYYSNLQNLINEIDKGSYSLLGKFSGILIDPGPSSIQKSNSKRGFDFKSNQPLDLRMEQDRYKINLLILTLVKFMNFFRKKKDHNFYIY